MSVKARKPVGTVRQTTNGHRVTRPEKKEVCIVELHCGRFQNATPPLDGPSELLRLLFCWFLHFILRERVNEQEPPALPCVCDVRFDGNGESKFEHRRDATGKVARIQGRSDDAVSFLTLAVGRCILTAFPTSFLLEHQT